MLQSIETRATPPTLLPHVDDHAPAREAWTDFRREPPFTVKPLRYIDDALEDMIRMGVRALLAVEDVGVVGLITAADILGERPIQFLQSPLCEGHPCQRRHVRVADIMTPWTELEFLDMAWVDFATVSDLEDRFRRTDTSHLLVVEGGAVRGLFSRTRLERQTGRSIPPPVG